MSYVDPSGNQCKAAKDRLAASTSKGKNETKTSTKLTEHQDSSSKGVGETDVPKRPGGYLKNDVDDYGNLSPQVNRAPGNQNIAADNRVQAHHPIQNEWAERNIPGYNKDKAPSILLESSSGKPHAKISALQRSRRKAEGYDTDIVYEFNTSYKEMVDAEVDSKNAKKAMRRAYKYFDELGGFK
ncbi:HNH/endonuclease VII toxin of polymorphic toxin system component [Lachnotalea glycerini]|uniref:HNH/endonuclease VII toxin of polymorphic toxin system component n=1 Tax=Lachnotalea glycerini TaxID=1763509 RepID=A0A318ELK0_9FIRM|nr:hypothetical protein [Lachnotalea glycerini]PXV84498.1 HNH/endonuclease VII toxin of polymorphic toxin system component [Lachnotalea glycerini]